MLTLHLQKMKIMNANNQCMLTLHLQRMKIMNANFDAMYNPKK
jgi:hypothetical protein